MLSTDTPRKLLLASHFKQHSSFFAIVDCCKSAQSGSCALVRVFFYAYSSHFNVYKLVFISIFITVCYKVLFFAFHTRLMNFGLVVMSIELDWIELDWIEFECLCVCACDGASAGRCRKNWSILIRVLIRCYAFTAYFNFSHKWNTINCLIVYKRTSIAHLLKRQLGMEIATLAALAFNWLYNQWLTNVLNWIFKMWP